MTSSAKVGIVPADDGRITIVISESVSPSQSGTEDVLKKDPAAEKAPDAGAVDSDKPKAMFAAHAPRPTAVFWSKFPRPTGPPTAPTGAVEGAFKKDIPAAESGAEASVDETGAIKNDPALKPVTKVATALKPAAAGGAPVPSIKDFPGGARPGGEHLPAPFCAHAGVAGTRESCRRVRVDPVTSRLPHFARRASTSGRPPPRSARSSARASPTWSIAPRRPPRASS